MIGKCFFGCASLGQSVQWGGDMYVHNTSIWRHTIRMWRAIPTTSSAVGHCWRRRGAVHMAMRGLAAAGSSGSTRKKTAPAKKSVETMYLRKTPREHILLRPETYIGSVQTTTAESWVLDSRRQRVVRKEITYLPGKSCIRIRMCLWCLCSSAPYERA